MSVEVQSRTLRTVRIWVIATIVCLVAAIALGQERKIVVGPRNAPLAQGARALTEGDAEEGVRLTLIGLRQAVGRQERVIGACNLCAGYIMQRRFSEALKACDTALEENETYWRARANRALIHTLEGRYDAADRDLELVEKAAPQANAVKAVRALLTEMQNPAMPLIIIDDRRDDDDEG